jgi:hypothetical protein
MRLQRCGSSRNIDAIEIHDGEQNAEQRRDHRMGIEK